MLAVPVLVKAIGPVPLFTSVRPVVAPVRFSRALVVPPAPTLVIDAALLKPPSVMLPPAPNAPVVLPSVEMLTVASSMTVVPV